MRPLGTLPCALEMVKVSFLGTPLLNHSLPSMDILVLGVFLPSVCELPWFSLWISAHAASLPQGCQPLFWIQSHLQACDSEVQVSNFPLSHLPIIKLLVFPKVSKTLQTQNKTNLSSSPNPAPPLTLPSPSTQSPDKLEDFRLFLFLNHHL